MKILRKLMQQKVKNSLLYLIILFLLIYFYNYFIITAQLYTNKSEYNATLSPDSLFLNFEKPELPKEFYKYFNINEKPNYQKKYNVESFQFVCRFTVDTNNKVLQKYTKIYPLFNKGNNLPYNHKLWKMVIDRIKISSKNWIAKRLYWDLKNFKDKESIEYYKKSNNNELSIFSRPSFGKQRHLMILAIYPKVPLPDSFEIGERYDYIYRIEVK